MRTKRLLVIMIASVFVLAAVFSFILIFSVRKVDVTYSVDQNTNVSEVQDKLDQYIGKNLMFVDLEEVESIVKAFPKYKVVSSSKKYPNVITLKVEERRVVYQYTYQDNVYGLDKEGFVVSSTPVSDWTFKDSEIIALDFSGVDVLSVAVGDYLKTSQNELLTCVLDMALSVRLTDCINKITVYKNLDFNDAVFYTDTGVTITIEDVLNRGVEKIVKGFESYDNAGDYIKSYNHIKVYLDQKNDQIVSIWSNTNEGD